MAVPIDHSPRTETIFFKNFFKRMLRKKQLLEKEEDLKLLTRSLTWVDLFGFGIGAIIGAGIFVLTGVAAKKTAGPAISVSFLVDAIACIFSGLCYAEFASAVPRTGSAYTYTYVTIGELPAFLIGWALIAEYAFASSAVARGWSGYLQALTGGAFPGWMIGIRFGDYININILAALPVVLITLYILLGIKSSSILNWIISGLSVLVILFVISYGATFVDTKNWENFAPYGFYGIFQGGGLVFFAYVGFDMIASFSEEVKKPQRDLPISIIGSLVFCSILYVAVSLIITGMVPYYDIDTGAPLSEAFRTKGSRWAEVIISLGAFAALTTSMQVTLVGCGRIILAISRDGIFPKFLSGLNSRTNEPWVSQIFCSVLILLVSLLFDIEKISEMVSIGTLSSFTFVNAAVLILRENVPEKPQSKNLAYYILAYVLGTATLGVTSRFLSNIHFVAPLMLLIVIPGILIFYHFYKHLPYPIIVNTKHFITPFVPLIPLLGIFINVYLICSLQTITWISFLVWCGIGLLVYFGFGFRNSVENRQNAEDGEQSLLFRIRRTSYEA